MSLQLIFFLCGCTYRGTYPQRCPWKKQKKKTTPWCGFVTFPAYKVRIPRKNSVKHRFMLMDRFGQYLQNILDRQGKTLSLKHAFSIIMPVLECFHSYEYIHTYADMKASWVPHCFSKNNENKLYRQDFGFIYRCTENGKRKEYEDDWRKAHDGTIEFTGPHNHTGAHSRRGDADLGFNVFQWLCCQLLWEDDLKNPEYVSQQKKAIVENIPLLMRCFHTGHSMWNHRVPAARVFREV
ncbi:serine/threonine-protein kinase VRK1-like [Rhipicephalus sanguineus]|uniref:serine/threonine-protein kinase VRK1-like n=1 Tax=Rhipicephalus sanguineus TaxID=34632 RepID=UPI001895D802|nr:serine/threonine-protein kinase VRK1-like [Rhipicephalus sanguineus]